MRERRFAGRIRPRPTSLLTQRSPQTALPGFDGKAQSQPGPGLRCSPDPQGLRTERQREELLLCSDSQHRPGPENSLAQGKKGTKFRTEAVLRHGFSPLGLS